jgi:error-prone DNA polymerase
MYTELQVTTNFTFLRGASHPHELVQQAAELGYKAIAITDRNTLAGIVRAHAAAKEFGIRVIVGCRLDLKDGAGLLAYPTNKDAYSRLSNLLTFGNLRAEKGECHLSKADVFEHAQGLKFVVLPPENLDKNFDLDHSFVSDLKQYHDVFKSHLYIGASRRFNGNDRKYLFRLAELSNELHIPVVATNDVHYHSSGRRQLQDIVTCVREKCTIYNAGFRLLANAERYLKSGDEMLRIFSDYPSMIARTEEIAEACQFLWMN